MTSLCDLTYPVEAGGCGRNIKGSYEYLDRTQAGLEGRGFPLTCPPDVRPTTRILA